MVKWARGLWLVLVVVWAAFVEFAAIEAINWVCSGRVVDFCYEMSEWRRVEVESYKRKMRRGLGFDSGSLNLGDGKERRG
jgi:hypothetical protein